MDFTAQEINEIFEKIDELNKIKYVWKLHTPEKHEEIKQKYIHLMVLMRKEAKFVVLNTPSLYIKYYQHIGTDKTIHARMKKEMVKLTDKINKYYSNRKGWNAVVEY
jgi:hypothetical protein